MSHKKSCKIYWSRVLQLFSRTFIVKQKCFYLSGGPLFYINLYNIFTFYFILLLIFLNITYYVYKLTTNVVDNIYEFNK